MITFIPMSCFLAHVRHTRFLTAFSLKNALQHSKRLGVLGFLSLSALSTQAMALNCVTEKNVNPYVKYYQKHPTIEEENTLCGTSAWNEFHILGTNATDNVHDMEGYADKDSVNIGETINLYVNTNAKKYPRYMITVYRLGWYQGTGAKLIKGSSVTRRSIEQNSSPTPDANGMVQANWTSPYTLYIPQSWVSGIYVATITDMAADPKARVGQYIPFVVRDKKRSSDYLYQVSTTTWQAYNTWGGKSLYGSNAARKVSFNRPYDVWGGLGALGEWDINMLYFLEREGYDVTYQSDTDTHSGDGGLLNHKAILSVGHDEYWSKAMRDNFENAQNHGIGLGFFGANDAYWQIRFENSTSPQGGCWWWGCPNLQNRTIVAYKDHAPQEDPLAIDGTADNNHLVTSRWRDPDWANRPENALIGVMYAFGPQGSFSLNSDILAAKNDPWQNLTNSHWIYTGTGTTVGSATTGLFKDLLGYEADRVFDNGKTPAGLDIIASSPVSLNVVDHTEFPPTAYDPSYVDGPRSHATVYSKSCSVKPCRNAVSTVFAAGSLQWVWGLDTGFKYPALVENTYIQQITRNALARMIDEPLTSDTTDGITTVIEREKSSLKDRERNPEGMNKSNGLMTLIKNQRRNWNHRLFVQK